MKKILIVTYSLSKTGGIEQVAKDIVNSLSDNFIVSVIAIDDKVERYKSKVIKKLYRKIILKNEIQKDINRFNADLIISLHPFLLDYLDLYF